MRIIAGKAKGRKLATPKSPLIRPVSDKVKESLFNILGPLDGCVVLDLFAGTGSVGLEAISRGATKVFFVDHFFESLKLLKTNSKQCGFEKECQIIRGKLPGILSRLSKLNLIFHIVFIDPPYDKNLVNPTLASLNNNKLIDAQSQIIIEHSPREMPVCQGFKLFDQRKYGQTFVSFLQCGHDDG